MVFYIFVCIAGSPPVTMSFAHLIETELMSVQQQEQQKQQQEVHNTTAQSEATTVTAAATPQHHQVISERNEEAATAEVAVYSRPQQQKDDFTANIANVTSWSEPVATTASSLPSPMTDIASRGVTASGVTTGSGDGRTSILERALSEIFPGDGEEEGTEDGTAAANGNRAPPEATNGNRAPSEATNGSRDGGEAAVIAETLSFTSDTSPWVQGGAF